MLLTCFLIKIYLLEAQYMYKSIINANRQDILMKYNNCILLFSCLRNPFVCTSHAPLSHPLQNAPWCWWTQQGVTVWSWTRQRSRVRATRGRLSSSATTSELCLRPGYVKRMWPLSHRTISRQVGMSSACSRLRLRKVYILMMNMERLVISVLYFILFFCYYCYFFEHDIHITLDWNLKYYYTFKIFFLDYASVLSHLYDICTAFATFMGYNVSIPWPLRKKKKKKKTKEWGQQVWFR